MAINGGISVIVLLFLGTTQFVQLTNGCDNLYATAHAGRYTSPNYPELYPDQYDSCSTIYAGEGQQVQLNFETFSVEYGSTCNYDYLQVRDGDNATSPVLATLCGYDLPENITSSGRSLQVEFFSDYSVNKTGFLVNFRAIGDAPKCWTTSNKHALQGTKIAKIYHNNLEEHKAICEFVSGCEAVICHKKTVGCTLLSDVTGTKKNKKYTSHQWGPCAT